MKFIIVACASFIATMVALAQDAPAVKLSERVTKIEMDSLLKRLDALLEYAVAHGEKEEAESLRRKLREQTEKI